MRLGPLSDRIIELLENKDFENPELFEGLEKLAFYLLVGMNFVDDTRVTKEIATIAAEDILMKAFKGRKIYAPIRYIMFAKYHYLDEWKKLNGTYKPRRRNPSQYDYEVASFLASNSGALSISLDFKRFQLRDYLESLDKVVYSELKSKCRYKEDTQIFKNIYLSVLASIAKQHRVFIFIPNSLRNYCMLMYNVIIDKIFMDITEITQTYDINEHNLFEIKQLTKACMNEELKYEGDYDD